MNWLKISILLVALGLMMSGDARAQGANVSDIKQADAAWNEKSYARALELYRKVLASGAPVREREEIEYRVAVSLGKTEQWDEAIAAGEALVAKTEWKARVLYWLGRLYTQVPDQAYRVNNKLYYGNDYPKIKDAEKPQQTWIGEENAEATLKYFEDAKVAAQIERDRASRSRYSVPIYPLPFDQEIDLNFDLAAFLPQRQMDEMFVALSEKKTLDETVDLSRPYDKSWHLAKKILYLYNEIPRLDQSTNKHDSALALLGKGLWVRSYRARMDQWANQWDEKQQKHVVRDYPFDHLEAIPIWQELVKQFPKDELAPQTQILIAQTWQQQGDLVKARAAYQVVVQKFPRSKWTNDARLAIEQITRREVNIDTMGAQAPGKTAKITVTSRNLKQIQLAAYAVKLENFLTRPNKLSSPSVSFHSFTENFGSIESATKAFGKPIATWTHKTKDKGDYEGVTETIDVPVQNLGAYAIVAQVPGVRAARLLLISDLAILKKVDRDSSFVYVADAKSGAPVMGANVVLKENYNQSGNAKVDIKSGQTDEIGLFDKKLMRDQNTYSNNVAAFAYLNGRYAMTGNYAGGYWYGRDQQGVKVYAYTDRPVYRPAQKVYFRQILTQYVKGGDQAPLKGQKVLVTINNPKGEKVFESTLTSSEFGTINGEFELPEETPLGEYYVSTQLVGSSRGISAQGGNRFRVEEYKRPEFQVSVDAPDTAMRPGETVSAKINAKYYFGSPVPNANVKYTVRRSTWWASYNWPTPYDWLFNYWNVGYYDTGRRNIGGEGSGTIVKEGVVKTDAQGNAEVSFATTRDEINQNDENWWWRSYSNPLYTIEVEVTDASRRTIEGQGSVKVANQQYFAFLEAKRGYYLSGDRVQVEVITKDANDKPVQTSGKMVVYKQLPGDKEEKKYEEVVQSDAQGRLVWTWPSDEAGTFRIAWEATDAWNQKVVGSTNIWIAGPQLNQTQFRLQGVTIVLDKRNYVEGDVAKVLLVADQPDTTILLTQEAGGDIIKREVVSIPGKNKEISIPITDQHVPNFSIAAALVKNYEVFQAQQEVFVPPTEQLIKVEVSGDKTEYKPGESGTFTVKATDWQGKPARAEISLALTDASLFYIQKDYAPDMRPFFYGDRRPISVQLDSHRSGQPEARVEDDTKYLKLETHNWELPDEFGQLNLDPSGGWGGYYGGRREMRRQRAGGFGGGIAMPMSAPAPAAAMDAASETSGRIGALESRVAAPARKAMEPSEADQSTLAPAQVRSNFAETAYWSPAVVTENGSAKVTVTFPDTLTQWHAQARGITQTAQVGSGENDVETKKNLLVRLQAPRFFVERDQVVLTANVHNYLKTDKQVRIALNLGDQLKIASTDSAALSKMVEGQLLTASSGTFAVKAGEEKRFNWIVDVVKDGEVSVQMMAQTNEESDAVKMEFPVLVHGVQRFAAQSGVLRDKNSQVITINLPKERRFGASSLNVQLNPSLAATMLDALPYLADYPYGCVEQTMSRFLPSVVVAKTLSDSGVNLATLRQRAKAYETEAKAQPIGERVKNSGYTYPTGMPNARDLNEMASRLWYTERRNNPVYDEKVLSSMVNDGLNRLYNMQRGDGGWGWWQGSSYSDEYMSAYVVYGLATAKAADVAVRDDVLQRGFNYLQQQMKDEDNLHLLTSMAYSLSLRGQMPNDVRSIVTGRLFEQRERLTAYSRSLLALALWNVGDKVKAGVVVRNLENTAKVDQENGTARWTNNDRYWWHWWNNDVETNAIALRAFLQIEPSNRLVPMMMKWLTTQQRGNHWRSTKETAMAVYALADYVRVNKELDVDYTLSVRLNNKMARTYRVTSENALYFDNRFITGDLFLENGANTLTIEKRGKGNLYWSAATEYFSLEEPIKASGNEIAVQRRYFKLTRNPDIKAEQGSDSPEQSSSTLDAAVAKVAPGRRPIMPRPIPAEPAKPEYKRTELQDGATLQSGDLIEVELVIDAKNDYEYLVFEDMKAAGLEPVDVRSGSAWGDGLSSNVELRDEKVAFFVDRLPQGTRVLRYQMRAEIPGSFHALPTNGYAMYAPEVRAISDEGRMAVRD